jgi:hypothetical protein
MNILIPIYLALCLIAGFFGRRRAMGFFGTLLFSLFLTPILIGAVLLLTACRPVIADKIRV